MHVIIRTLVLRLLLRLFLAGAPLLQASCSGRIPVYPVSGKVLFQGRPAQGAVVQFHPQEGTDTTLAPRGEVDADGTFRLTTYQHQDGAPAGRYAVTVFWGVPSKGGDQFDRVLVPQRYLNPATSGLTAEVPNRAIDLPPFQLTK
jgi:hypothetical protein